MSDRRGGGGTLARAAAIGLGTALLGIGLTLLPATLELEENVGLAWLFGLRGDLAPPGDVVVVSIDSDSADALGLSSALNEWPRSLHAELVDGLTRAGAAVVAFDVIFDRRRGADDRNLSDALARAGNVILLERVRSDRLTLPADTGAALEAVRETRIPPIEELKRVALATAPFPLPVVPIRVGQFWVFGRGPGDVATLPAVALQAFALPVYERFLAVLAELRPAAAASLPQTGHALYARGGLEETVTALREMFNADPAIGTEMLQRLDGERRAGQAAGDSGNRTDTALLLALLAMYAGSDSRYLSYYGPPRTLATVPYYRVLERLAAGESLVELRDKVVFIGFSERRQPEQQDAFYSVFSDRGGRDLSGVEIAATAFANLLEQRFVHPLPIPRQVMLVAGWGVVLAALLVFLPGLPGLLTATAGAAAYAWAAVQLFSADGLWLPLLVPVAVQLPVASLAALLWSYRSVREQRHRIQTALGYYLPAPVVEKLARESIESGAGGQLLHGTCLVTDADQYTTLSETLSPDLLAQLLSDYYAVLFRAVKQRGGLIADVAGDSMVAVWAAAQPRPDTNSRACLAALDALADVESFNRERFNRGRQQQGLPTRIGLDCGQLMLGNIGAGDRFEYRAVGDIVNTAARLQGLNRQLGTRILLSASTLAGTQGLPTRNLGSFLLVGKTSALEVHELLDPGRAQHDPAPLLAAFAAALALFRQREWSAAGERFAEILGSFPDDGPSRFYRALCEQYRSAAPPPPDGIVRITVK